MSGGERLLELLACGCAAWRAYSCAECGHSTWCGLPLRHRVGIVCDFRARMSSACWLVDFRARNYIIFPIDNGLYDMTNIAKQIAEAIFEQLGGRRFTQLTGA